MWSNVLIVEGFFLFSSVALNIKCNKIKCFFLLFPEGFTPLNTSRKSMLWMKSTMWMRWVVCIYEYRVNMWQWFCCTAYCVSPDLWGCGLVCFFFFGIFLFLNYWEVSFILTKHSHISKEREKGLPIWAELHGLNPKTVSQTCCGLHANCQFVSLSNRNIC